VYATTLGGVFKSLDGGCSWNDINTGLSGAGYTTTLAIDPTNPSNLYLGRFYDRIWRSVDGGESWSPVSEGLPYQTVTSIAIDPTNPDHLWVADVYYFEDVGGGVGAVYESEDAGQTWSPASNGLPTVILSTLVLDPQDPTKLWLSTESNGVFRTVDGAATWTAASAGLEVLGTGVMALLPGPSPRLLLANSGPLLDITGSGISRSDDGAVHWEPSREGLRLAAISRVAAAPTSPGTLFTVGRYNAGGVSKSVDAGETWQNSGAGLVAQTQTMGLAIDPTDASIVYVSQRQPSPNTFKSTDGGASWNPSANGLNGDEVFVLAIDPADGEHIFAGGVGNSYFSTDGAASWTPSTTGVRYASSMVAVGGNLVYALGYDPVSNLARPFVSGNGGDTWIVTDVGLPSSGLLSLAADPSEPDVLYIGTSGLGLFRTVDGGSQWSPVGNFSAFTIQAIAVNPSDPDDFFIGTTGTGDGVLRSRDGGLTWDPLVRGLDEPASRDIYALDVPPGGSTVHAVTPAGVFDLTISDAPWPVPSTVAPASGPRTGGTDFTIAGLEFQDGAEVLVGGIPASSVNVVDGGTIEATTPSGSSGAVDVVVRNPDTQFETLLRGFVFDFDDVPPAAHYHDEVVALTASGATVGCGENQFCPDLPITRAQMAVLVERAMHGPGFAYPTPTVTFDDVFSCSGDATYILQMASEGITAGCGGNLFCPENGNTRAQAAVFALKAEHGSNYVPPPPTGTVFVDVPADAFAADFIEQLALEGITAGCGGNHFCPNDLVSRAQAAVFLSRAVLSP